MKIKVRRILLTVIFYITLFSVAAGSLDVLYSGDFDLMQSRVFNTEELSGILQWQQQGQHVKLAIFFPEQDEQQVWEFSFALGVIYRVDILTKDLIAVLHRHEGQAAVSLIERTAGSYVYHAVIASFLKNPNNYHWHAVLSENLVRMVYSEYFRGSSQLVDIRYDLGSQQGARQVIREFEGYMSHPTQVLYQDRRYLFWRERRGTALSRFIFSELNNGLEILVDIEFGYFNYYDGVVILQYRSSEASWMIEHEKLFTSYLDGSTLHIAAHEIYLTQGLTPPQTQISLLHVDMETLEIEKDLFHRFGYMQYAHQIQFLDSETLYWELFTPQRRQIFQKTAGQAVPEMISPTPRSLTAPYIQLQNPGHVYYLQRDTYQGLTQLVRRDISVDEASRQYWEGNLHEAVFTSILALFLSVLYAIYSCLILNFPMIFGAYLLFIVFYRLKKDLIHNNAFKLYMLVHSLCFLLVSVFPFSFMTVETQNPFFFAVFGISLLSAVFLYKFLLADENPEPMDLWRAFVFMQIFGLSMLSYPELLEFVRDFGLRT